MDNKNLSQDEIDAIARKVVEQLQNDLYVNVGSGLIALAWKGIMLILIMLAAYGATKHFNLLQ